MEIKDEKTYRIIAKALADKKMISFIYISQNGTKQPKTKFCMVEPYLIGQHKNTKNIMLSAYFLPTAQQLIADEVEDWKLYLIQNINSLTVLDISFATTRENYNPNPQMMDKVLICIPA